MININLVPLELRKNKKQSSSQGDLIPVEVVIGAGGGLILLLIVAHIVLLGFNLTRFSQYKILEKQSTDIMLAKKNVDVVVAELRTSDSKEKQMNSSLEINKILWSEKLNILSDNLSRGVWLNKVSLMDDVFLIDGSAISHRKKEMLNVHSFVTSLKNSKNFLKHVGDIETGTMQRRKIKKIEIVDFLVTVYLEEK